MELSPLATGVERRVDIGRGNPHAHWMSADGHKMVTPNILTGDTTQFDFPADRIDSILPTSSPFGHPIATGMMPDASKYYVANTLTGTILVTNTQTDTVVAMLGCDPGCHGVQYGAKRGGGYYAYVSSKFSNRLLVVDPDPNGDGNPVDAAIVGSVGLVRSNVTQNDAAIAGNAGMGGQGLLPIPVVYNGWVQNLPAVWRNLLTPAQRNPIP